MKQLYYFLVLLFLTLAVTTVKAQVPANDSICNAQNLGTLPAPASCGGATTGTKKGTKVTVAGTNVNATPELTYPYNPNCPPNLTNPPADVWYSFVASSYQTVIAITGAAFANPIIAVWQGTCTGYASIGCVSGTANAASLTVIALTPGNTYYVQVSGLDGTQTGTYTMTLQSETDCANCLVASTTTATPAPTNGYYKPNTTVTFCDSIYNWDQTSANWLHGVQWTFGAGWNQATLITSTVAVTPTAGSCSQDGGHWAWYPNGTTSSATGNHFGAGYYYETASGSTSGTIDNDPGNNYGDDDVNNCTWKFCVTITTNAACTPGSNLDVSIDATGDGQSGSWTSPACANDPITDLYAVGSCCPPSMSSTPATCANPNAGTATATPDGTNSPWTFAWSNGVTQTGLTGPSTITGLAQGIDTVTVTDALNCTVTATVTVGGPPTGNAGPNQTICQNTTATMAATSTGSWTAVAGNPATVTFTTPSSATSTVTGFTVAGIYTLQWTTSTGCVTTMKVTVNPLPTPTVNSPSMCVGTAATLTTSGGGTYAWSPTTNMTPPAGNTASVTVTPGATTTYDVTVTTAAGCSASASGTVTVNPLPTPTVNSPSMCVGTSATLTTSGGGTYAWSPTTNMTPPAGNTATVTVTPGATTTYDVTVTSAAGCSATASGTVTVNPLPTPTVNSPSICAGASATLTTSGGGTYAWSPTTNMAPPAGNTASVTVTPGVTTTYDVTVTSAAGCSATASGTVTVNTIAPPTVNNATICAGTSATLTTSGGATYAWSPTTNMTPPAGNTASVTVTPTVTTTYTVTVTTAAGCTASASGTVTVNPLPTPTVNSPSMCAGTSATLTTSGGATYAWSPTTNMTPPAGNTATVTVTPPSTTTYTVTVTTAAGCSATASGTVTVNPLPTPTVNSPSICAGQSVTIGTTGGGTYTWSPTTNMVPAAGNTDSVTVTPPSTTTYDVTVTSTAGCSATASGTVTVNTIAPPTVNSATICAGNSATLTTSGGATYAWSPTTNMTPPAGNTATVTVTPTATTTYTVTVTTAAGCSASASGTVTVNPLPTPTVNSPSMCIGTSATLTTSGGATYAWSPTTNMTPPAGNTATVTVTPGATTTYDVTVTSAAGCSATASGTVTVNPLPTPTVNSPSICAGQSATLTTSGGGTYAWSPTTNMAPPAGNTASVTVTPGVTTTYDVTVTSAAGCSATASGTVTVNTIAPPTVNNASVCLGGSATLTTSGGATYAWSPTTNMTPPAGNTASVTVTPTTTTTYDVTVTTAAGCSATASGTVTVINPPSVSAASISICSGNTGSLNAIPTITGGAYTWNPGNASTQTITVAPTTTTTYTVTYVISGCPAATANPTVTVNPLPTPTVNSPTICAGTSATLTATGGVSYDWSTNQTINPITVTPASTTTYTVTATDANSCSATASGTVTVTPLPTVSLSNATICAGNSATLTPVVSPAGGTYLWSDNETTNTILVTPATTTYFTVTYTASGCSSSAVDTVTVNPLPTPTVNSPTICTGVSATLTATGGVSYNWSTNQTINPITVTPVSTTTYDVTATDINGCSATASGTVTVNPLPTPTVNDSTVCAGVAATLTATGGVSYQWSYNNATTSSITVTPATTTTYTVTATDANGCSATTSGTVTVNPMPSVSLGNASVCLGNSATLSPSVSPPGGTYLWSTNETTNTILVTPAATQDFTVTYTLSGCSFSASDIVTVNPLPVVTVSTDPALCTSTNGMAIANVSAGTPAYSYSWSAPGGTRDTLPNIAAGTYQVTVSDINGCTATASGQVSQQVSTIAVTEVSQHNLRCNNDGSGDIYISLSDNAGNVGSYTYTYNWTVASTQNLTGVQAGTYTVTVTDQFGCTGTGTWTITQPPLLTASATGTNPICFGQSNGSATVTPTGGTPNYSYSWNTSPVQTTATANNIPSGSYTVTVTDDSLCTATASVTLTDPAQITFGPSTIVNPSCFGLTNGSAQVSPQNGIGTYTYSWSTTPAQTSNPATDLAGGSYTVTATDANGCTASTTVNLVTPSQVQVTATGTNLSCYESGNGTATASASGGTPPYSYIWSNQDNTASISGLAAAAYSVTATDANGCTASASDTLSQPDAVSETLTSVRTNCPNSADGSITAVAGGGTPSFTYSLENANGTTVLQSGNTTGDFTGIGYGLYTVMATDANGCKISDTITVPEAPFNYYTDTTTGTTCYGSQYTNGSIELQGYSIPNGPFQYSINGGPFQVSPYFFDLAAGSYQVTAQDHYGCDTTFTVVVPSPLPATVQILPGDSTITAGSTLQLTTVFGPYSTDSITGYAWSPGTGMSCIDCPSPEVSPYANQTIYTVIITYNQGCTASATVQINTNGEPPMYIPNAFTPNGDGVNDVWYVFGTGIKDIKIMVFDRWGEKVFESDDQSVGWDGTYRGKIQQPDVFIYEINAVYLDGTTISKQGSLTLIR